MLGALNADDKDSLVNNFTGILNGESAQRTTDAEIRVLLSKENGIHVFYKHIRIQGLGSDMLKVTRILAENMLMICLFYWSKFLKWAQKTWSYPTSLI